MINIISTFNTPEVFLLFHYDDTTDVVSTSQQTVIRYSSLECESLVITIKELTAFTFVEHLNSPRVVARNFIEFPLSYSVIVFIVSHHPSTLSLLVDVSGNFLI